MKFTIHITYFYLESRIKYINNIINETNNYEQPADIYIHTNNFNLNKTSFDEYTNGCINIIHYDLTNTNPELLSWKCRDLMKQQINEYDVFIYIEDDILVPYKAIKYWMKYNEKLIDINYNIGFVRIEFNNDIEYITDLEGDYLDTCITLDEEYCVNNKNPYCAFWIYNKNEFIRFVNSPYYDIRYIRGYDPRAASAIGLHGLYTNWYKNTIIPIVNKKLIEDCKIYHMPNNYIGHKDFATIKFDEAIKL
jgi:hypothetical protein